MKVIVMAGGKGTRLKIEIEKPLLKLFGKSLIDHMLTTLNSSKKIEKIYISVSPHTLRTKAYLVAKYGGRDDIAIVDTEGKNYHADMQEVIKKEELFEPVLVISSDIPLIKKEFIEKLVDIYLGVEENALAVFMPADSLSASIGSLLEIKGKKVIPCGVNIVDGRMMDSEIPQFDYITENVDHLININTIDDLKKAEKIVKAL